MDEGAKGRTLVETERHLDDTTLGGLERAVGTSTGMETATLVPFFGPTVAGERTVVDGLGLDLSKALLGGQSYEWVRPFTPGEKVTVKVVVEDIYQKGPMQFGIVVSEFRDDRGELVQRQRTTFIERGGGS